MKVIGLTGFAKSGKSTAAQILKELGGQEVAFAKHLKDVCAVVFEVPRDHFDDQAFKEVSFDQPLIVNRGQIEDILRYFDVSAIHMPAAVLAHNKVQLKSPRHVAQYVGTEILRSIDQNIHINMAFKLNANSTAKFLVCSDMRFDNELRAVNSQSGLTIGISRKKAVPANLQNLHPSEAEIPNLISRSDLIVENEGSIEDLQKTVRDAALVYLGV